MNFDKYAQQMVDYCKNSGITVEYSRAMDWVEILDTKKRSIFAQGEDAASFIRQADKVADDYRDETFDDCFLIVAYPYADLLAEL